MVSCIKPNRTFPNREIYIHSVTGRRSIFFFSKRKPSLLRRNKCVFSLSLHIFYSYGPENQYKHRISPSTHPTHSTHLPFITLNFVIHQKLIAGISLLLRLVHLSLQLWPISYYIILSLVWFFGLGNWNF